MVSGVAVVLLVGCGFNVQESTVYTVPNWTQDGRIIARKQYMRSHSNLISNSVLDETRNSVVVMNADGTNEQRLFDDVEVSIQLIEMSPAGNYVGYLDANDNLKVFKNEGGWRLMWSKAVDSSTDRIEFSPDETKVYVSIGTAEFFVYDINGVELVHNTSGGGGEFIDNNRVVFNQDSTTALKLSVYDILAGATVVLLSEVYVDEYVSSDNSVVTRLSAQILKTSLATGMTSTQNISYSPYAYSDFTGRHISPDGTKMVMSYDSVDNVGIYVLDIANSRIDQLK